jgi:hypothetical protein
MALRPDRLRIDLFGAPGRRTASVASDGKWIYLLSHADGRFHKKRRADDVLENMISIPVRLTDLNDFFTGRMPLRQYESARVETGASEKEVVLVLTDKWRHNLEKLYIDTSGQTVQAIDMFDAEGTLLFRADFDRNRSVGEYTVPFKMVISNRDGILCKLGIERFWADIPVSPSVFVLAPPERK